MRSKASNVVRKVSNPAVHTEQVVRVPETANYAVSATLLINLKTVQHLAKNAINVVLRIISVHAVDLQEIMNKALCRGRTPTHGRSTERHHRPGRGRRSRSRSHSRSGSQTRNTHSIEIDRYDIDDIDVLKTFHSISRSKTVAAISNDTDPDGKMKILTKLKSQVAQQTCSRHHGSESQ